MFAGAPTATPTVVWAPESPTGTPVADGLYDQVFIYTPELREAIACKFIAQENYALARHHCDLSLATLQSHHCDSLTN